jgi:hypothetical protein
MLEIDTCGKTLKIHEKMNKENKSDEKSKINIENLKFEDGANPYLRAYPCFVCKITDSLLLHIRYFPFSFSVQ